MSTPPLPPVRRRPLSPSSSLNSGTPPTHRRLFSTPLQPPVARVPPPPHLTLSFNVDNSATSDLDIPVFPPPRHTLSFRIGDSPVLNVGNDIRTFVCLGVSSLRLLTLSQRDRPGLNLPSTRFPDGAHTNRCQFPPTLCCTRQRRPGALRGISEDRGGYTTRLLPTSHFVGWVTTIDEYTYIVQDWNEHLGILEVSLAVSPL